MRAYCKQRIPAHGGGLFRWRAAGVEDDGHRPAGPVVLNIPFDIFKEETDLQMPQASEWRR